MQKQCDLPLGEITCVPPWCTFNASAIIARKGKAILALSPMAMAGEGASISMAMVLKQHDLSFDDITCVDSWCTYDISTPKSKRMMDWQLARLLWAASSALSTVVAGAKTLVVLILSPVNAASVVEMRVDATS